MFDHTHCFACKARIYIVSIVLIQILVGINLFPNSLNLQTYFSFFSNQLNAALKLLINMLSELQIRSVIHDPLRDYALKAELY